jgi:hypothetical protein
MNVIAIITLHVLSCQMTSSVVCFLLVLFGPVLIANQKQKKCKSIIIQLDNSIDQPKQVTLPKPRSFLLNQSGSSSNQRESPNSSDGHVAEIASGAIQMKFEPERNSRKF